MVTCRQQSCIDRKALFRPELCSLFALAKNPWYLIRTHSLAKSQAATDLWSRPERFRMARVKSVNIEGLYLTN